MQFLKPAKKHWKPSDYGFEHYRFESASPDSTPITNPIILHLVKTTALLESRSDQYSDYLRSVIQSRDEAWQQAIDRWNFEEHQHGVVLQLLSQAMDQSFPFAEKMTTYLEGISYHQMTGQSVRGSIAGELVARCVVEALASSFYNVLHDMADDRLQKQIFRQLAKDEARHFGMFYAMLETETRLYAKFSVWQRLKVVLARMAALNDAQIMFASHVVGNQPNAGFAEKKEAVFYLSLLYPFYQWKHILFISKLLSKTVFGGMNPWHYFSMAVLMYVALKGRLLWFKLLGAYYARQPSPAPSLTLAA